VGALPGSDGGIDGSRQVEPTERALGCRLQSPTGGDVLQVEAGDAGNRVQGFLEGALSPKGVSYLVDPASSHMLVSKIKPCMSKYKLLHSETANGSLNQLWFLRSYYPTWITVAILELIHARKLRPSGKSAFIRSRPITRKGVPLVSLDNFGLIAWPCASDVSFKCLPYQLSSVFAMTTEVFTGNGE